MKNALRPHKTFSQTQAASRRKMVCDFGKIVSKQGKKLEKMWSGLQKLKNERKRYVQKKLRS